MKIEAHQYYHVYNRGNPQQVIFLQRRIITSSFKNHRME